MRRTASAATRASTPAAAQATVHSPCVAGAKTPAEAAPNWGALKIQAKTTPACLWNVAVASAEVGGTVATQSSPYTTAKPASAPYAESKAIGNASKANPRNP